MFRKERVKKKPTREFLLILIDDLEADVITLEMALDNLSAYDDSWLSGHYLSLEDCCKALSNAGRDAKTDLCTIIKSHLGIEEEPVESHSVKNPTPEELQQQILAAEAEIGKLNRKMSTLMAQ